MGVDVVGWDPTLWVKPGIWVQRAEKAEGCGLICGACPWPMPAAWIAVGQRLEAGEEPKPWLEDDDPILLIPLCWSHLLILKDAVTRSVAP